MPRLPRGGLIEMDALALSAPRRLNVPIDNRWGGGEMAVLDFGDPARPVDLIFAHANGFNAYAYRSLLQPLSGALRIWAPDLRGHGRSRLPARPEGRRSWKDHRDDLIALLDAVDGPSVALAGHSIGGTSGLLAAAERPERVSRLLLLDPVIWRREMVVMMNLPLVWRLAGRNPIVAGTRKRRALFDSREQALQAYRGRGAFKGWSDLMLADYLVDGLAETDRGFELTCTPDWEASNYAAQAHNPWQALRRYPRAVRILKAESGALCAVPTTTPDVVRLQVESVAGGGHLFPMTHPDIVRDALLDIAV
ncbi:pimeloyl-ACP methyl ester carboxylesterase [Brevundimonas bullata]|uniref:Pimeloyl-ACP methyl ester carboxylesterase n=1 Tax=Brevundimonas bullata TaxID=13160 RepID=A0A7W7ILZ4_9CAUL|nr:alpha/beta hydrolase [Brevundimonas bullata]MBB4796792.1 pimeloyl-ACP methyl ester carboxylesterase [Brevundimonas bullata]MBB6381751.1 pimeloyl-ACP methyl ester carboxylesterase [Brevundimonas bullata]